MVLVDISLPKVIMTTASQEPFYSFAQGRLLMDVGGIHHPGRHTLLTKLFSVCFIVSDLIKDTI